jgi:hypothetical protein
MNHTQGFFTIFANTVEHMMFRPLMYIGYAFVTMIWLICTTAKKLVVLLLNGEDS